MHCSEYFRTLSPSLSQQPIGLLQRDTTLIVGTGRQRLLTQEWWRSIGLTKFWEMLNNVGPTISEAGASIKISLLPLMSRQRLLMMPCPKWRKGGCWRPASSLT